jgi:M6 family metalloprotease-like protein
MTPDCWVVRRWRETRKFLMTSGFLMGTVKHITVVVRSLPDKRVFFWATLLLLVAWSAFISPVGLSAAPFAEFIEYTQPDNTQVTLWGEGDEFHADFETTTGYTVVFDPQQKAYFYAKRSSDGKSLLSTGVLAHHQAPHALVQHARINPDAAKAKARAKRKQWESDVELPERWLQLKSQSQALGTQAASVESGPESSPPSSTTTGAKVGLTLLIDFTDDPATIPQANIESFLNGDNYTGYGNNGSVKKYFSDVSDGNLTYTNVVTFYVRMTQPKSYYNDISKDNGVQGRLLINDALAILKARSDYTSTILPTFDLLTVDGSNRVLAFNVFYAGGNGNAWSYGLWPHSWALASSVALNNGKSIYRYQLTNVGTSLALGTFCHENGHMLCGFPDLYDYGVNGLYDSKGGAGVFSLMGYGGSGTNPKQVDAYLKLAAGWATAIDITSSSNLTGTLVAAPNSGYNKFYRYRKPGVTIEYFLLENRQKTGRDSGLPAAGIAVWHVDQLGNRDNQSMTPNSSHLNYELTLVQADNLWHFQNNTNSGDAYDLYYLGNSAAAYINRLDDVSSPNSHWWDGTSSAMNLSAFSATGISMTFNVSPPITVPGAPTITSVKAGNTQSSVYLAPPASDGGSAITAYTVIPNAGQPASGTAIPITVPNLSNGVIYSFTVTATNAAGTGPPSVAWAGVTPGVVVIDDAYATGYLLLQNAYNANSSGKDIEMLSNTIVGGLTVNASNSKGSITVIGGYDNAFYGNGGTPSILGKVTLSAGKTSFQNVIVRAP